MPSRCVRGISLFVYIAKVLQISETRKNMVIDLIYRGFF